MITVQKLNNESIYINPDLLRLIEQTPDTLLTFIDGVKLVVRESPDEIITRIIEYRKHCQHQPELKMKDSSWI
jgi:flagellar protein FlbD